MNLDLDLDAPDEKLGHDARLPQLTTIQLGFLDPSVLYRPLDNVRIRIP